MKKIVNRILKQKSLLYSKRVTKIAISYCDLRDSKENQYDIGFIL